MFVFGFLAWLFWAVGVGLNFAGLIIYTLINSLIDERFVWGPGSWIWLISVGVCAVFAILCMLATLVSASKEFR